MKVLVVDDVDVNLAIAEELLKLYNIQVDTANSGYEAISKIENINNNYSLVFMDYFMPGIDGIETAYTIRGLGYTGKIIALTASVAKTSNLHGVFDGFLSKPIEIKELEIVLSEYISIAKPANEQPCRHEQNQTRLLRAFKKDAVKAVDALHSAFETNDLKLFTSTFHAMKSALANVGEDEHAEIAANLEEAGRRRDLDYIKANVKPLLEKLEQSAAMLALDESQISDDSHINEDAASVTAQLCIIKSACDDYDIGTAESAFNALLGTPLKNKTRKFIEEMHDLLYSDSDFEGVSEKIADFM
jgi:CheY-like chemotaxis protein